MSAINPRTEALRQKLALVGSTAIMSVGKLAFDVHVLDFKNAYGNDRWLVTPAAGSGEAWVETVTPKQDA